MKTLRAPVWHTDFTKKQWSDKKSSKVKKTGIGERLEKAKKLFTAVKWELYDASRAKQRVGYGVAIKKLADAQLVPIQDLADEINVLATKASKDPKADDAMTNLCKVFAARASVVTNMINEYIDDALEIAAEFDANSAAYATALKNFIRSFSGELKTLDQTSKQLGERAKKTESYLQRAIEQDPPLSIRSATLAQIEAGGISKDGAKLDAERDTYKAKMDAGRNITPATYGLTTQDVQAHNELMLITRRLFEQFDKIYREIDQSVAQAEKCAKDAKIFIEQSNSDFRKWQQKVNSDIESLSAIFGKMTFLMGQGWGNQVMRQGAVLDERIQYIKTASDATRASMIASGIKSIQDASTLFPKAHNAIKDYMDTIDKNYLSYKAAIPLQFQMMLAAELQRMQAVADEAENRFTEFETNYDISMNKIKLLEETVKKYSK